MIGNTYDNKSVGYKHARKVWREIRQVYPGGGVIDADTYSAVLSGTSGVIPAGTPVKFDPATKTISLLSAADIKVAGTEKTPAEGSNPAVYYDTLAELGLNGYLQEDAVITDANTVATGTVVYDGALYEYMYDSDVVAAIKAANPTPMVVWVQ